MSYSATPNPKEINWLLQEKYHGIKSSEFEADILRLKKGEPLAYVIGWIPFYNCKIDLSLHPLIPRTETELMVERAVKELKAINKETLRIADTFSGSGCIGIALLKNLPNAEVELFEYDSRLVKQIGINIKLNNIDDSRVIYQHSDALNGLSGTYDAIFANPPYIDPSTINEIESSVMDHEPHLALFGGKDGLDYIKLIINNGRKFINTNGKFYIEYGDNQKGLIEKMLIDSPWRHEFWLDQYGRNRTLVLYN